MARVRTENWVSAVLIRFMPDGKIGGVGREDHFSEIDEATGEVRHYPAGSMQEIPVSDLEALIGRAAHDLGQINDLAMQVAELQTKLREAESACARLAEEAEGAKRATALEEFRAQKAEERATVAQRAADSRTADVERLSKALDEIKAMVDTPAAPPPAA